jgi:hypothetical protein
LNILDPSPDPGEARRRSLRNVYRVLLEAALKAGLKSEVTAEPGEFGQGNEVGASDGSTGEQSGFFLANSSPTFTKQPLPEMEVIENETKTEPLENMKSSTTALTQPTKQGDIT